MRCVVTGGLGFVGSQIVRDLLENNAKVLVVDNLSKISKRSKEFFANGNCEIFECNISNKNLLVAKINDFCPDVIYHMAAMHYIPECNKNPEKTIDVNIKGLQTVVSSFEELAKGRLVFISSGAVYKDSADPLEEKSEIELGDIYALSKYAGENICRLSSRAADISIVRLFNVYGSGETNPHILPEIIEQLRYSRTLQLGDVDPVRDFIHVTDASEAIRKVGETDCDGRIFNVSGDAAVSVREIIDIVSEILGYEIEVMKDPARYRKNDKKAQVADIKKIRELLGWNPMVGLREGLEDLLREEGFLRY